MKQDSSIDQESQDQKTIRFEELLNEIDQLSILIDIEKEASACDEKNYTSIC